MIFRTAISEDATKLTKLTLESKKYWEYPKEWMSMWVDELTINPEYIQRNMVTVVEENLELLGYVSIVEESSSHIVELQGIKLVGGFFLDNLFIHPSYIRKGIGEKLIAIAFDWCKGKSLEQLYVISDPNAKGFYEKMGAICIGELPSRVEGRHLYCLVFNIVF